jgi:capsular polysaccharide biosynthesis protein
MYLIDALSVLLRRWYVVLVGALLMLGGAAAVFAVVPTTYQSSGQMLLLLPPGASGTDKPVNPYLNLQSGLTTAASLVSGAVSTKDVQRELTEKGFDAEYAVAVVPGTGPLITVTAKDIDPELAVETRDAVMSWIDAEMAAIQQEVDVPRDQYIRATRSSVSSGAEVLPGSKLRALVGVAVLGGVLTLAMTFLVDRLLVRRAARRGSPAEPAVEEPIGPRSVPTSDDEEAIRSLAEKAGKKDRGGAGPRPPVPLKRTPTPDDEEDSVTRTWRERRHGRGG